MTNTIRPTLPVSRGTNDQITTPDWDTQALQAGSWEQEVLRGIHSTDKVAGAALQQLPQAAINQLTNGGFDIWQRGNGPFVAATGADNACADAWFVSNGQVDREQVTTDSTANAARLTTTAANGAIGQIVYEATPWRGKSVALWGRMFATTAGNVYLVVTDDGGGTANSLIKDVSGGWTTLSAVMTVSQTATTLTVWAIAQTAGTYYVDNMMLALAPGPQIFLPLPPALDWLRCQRRYLSLPFSYRFRSQASGETQYATVTYPTPLIATPPTGFASLNLGMNVNINIGATGLFDVTTTEARVAVVASATASDTSIRLGTIIVDAGIF